MGSKDKRYTRKRAVVVMPLAQTEPRTSTQPRPDSGFNASKRKKEKGERKRNNLGTLVCPIGGQLVGAAQALEFPLDAPLGLHIAALEALFLQRPLDLDHDLA